MTADAPAGPRYFQAILFDMDGVLIDSEPAHERATDEIARAAGLGPVTPDVFARYFFGRTDFLGFQTYLAAIGRTDVAVDELMRRKAAVFARRFPTEVRPLCDGLDLLRKAARRGIGAAIVSGARNSEIELVLDRFALRGLVPVTVGGDDVPIGKPDPAPYLTGATRLGVPPERCLVIEDAPPGIASARAAGMRCLAVDRLGHPERLDGATRIVTRLSMATVLELDAAAAGQALAGDGDTA